MRAPTDEKLSISSSEFLWEAVGIAEFHRWVLPIVHRWLEEIKPSSILDIGCGNGAVTHWLSQRGYRVIGLDSSESAIQIAENAYPDITFIKAELNTPLDKDLVSSFDLVICLDVIEHMLLPRQVFDRSREALPRGGHLIIWTPYHGYLKNLLLALTNRFDRHWHPLRDYGHVKFFSTETFKQLCVEQDFLVLRFAKAGRIPALAKSMVALLQESTP